MKERIIVVTQGEHAVSDAPDVVLSAVLGSCVAVCLWDPKIRIGGMNHILLSDDTPALPGKVPCAVNVTELLIDALIAKGARRDRLVAKLFGGATMGAGRSRIGAANAGCALDFLHRTEIRVLASSLGGETARHVMFWPHCGAARQKRAPHSAVQMDRPRPSAQGTGSARM